MCMHMFANFLFDIFVYRFWLKYLFIPKQVIQYTIRYNLFCTINSITANQYSNKSVNQVLIVSLVQIKVNDQSNEWQYMDGDTFYGLALKHKHSNGTGNGQTGCRLSEPLPQTQPQSETRKRLSACSDDSRRRLRSAPLGSNRYCARLSIRLTFGLIIS